jgi:uncharacterized protein (DUF2147 family)
MKTMIFSSTFTSPALALVFVFVFVGFPAAPSHAADTQSLPDLQSPVGLWKTVDDKTGKPRALVRVFLQDGKYFGKIEQSFTPGAENRVCSVCTDERKNQPILGLLIIRNVTLHDGEYGGGDILDPDSGSVYRCRFHLDQGGTVLVVRGFIGFSLLGRSQTWQRQT